MPHIPRFLMPAENLREGTCVLPAHEARHALTVLRLRPGDAVEVIDGAGRLGTGGILDTDGDAVRLTIGTLQHVPPPAPRLTLATAIPKGKRWQALVEKCTELAVSRIQPVIFARSVAEGQGDPEKWRRWTAEAAKQCGALHLPDVAPPLRFADLLQLQVAGPCLLAAPAGDPFVRWGGQIDRASEILVVVGPEGGLAPEEDEACRNASFCPVRLGPYVLRVETAAMAACALVRGIGI